MLAYASKFSAYVALFLNEPNSAFASNKESSSYADFALSSAIFT